jgi:hypothetical protein
VDEQAAVARKGDTTGQRAGDCVWLGARSDPCKVPDTGVTSLDVEVEIVTLSLGYEPVDLPYVDAKEIRDRLVEGRVPTQELRHVLSNALDAGRGRIHENHRPELLTALEGIKSERPDHFSPALRRLYEVTQKPITP